MLVGYMRVSSTDDRQSVDLQRDALTGGGVDERHLYSDKASGARDDRTGLKACLEYLKSGDTLIVWKLDRMGRSLAHLLAIMADLKDRGIAFRSLTEQMDTATPHGELLFSLFGVLAQYERALTHERIMTGLAAARRRGRHGGRPRQLTVRKSSRSQLPSLPAPANPGSAAPSECPAQLSPIPWSGLDGRLGRLLLNRTSKIENEYTDAVQS